MRQLAPLRRNYTYHRSRPRSGPRMAAPARPEARWLQGSAESGPKIGNPATWPGRATMIAHQGLVTAPRLRGRAQLVTTGPVLTGLETTGLVTTAARPVEPRTTSSGSKSSSSG